jgi:hypothetical protein
VGAPRDPGEWAVTTPEPGPIEQATTQLADWLSDVTGQAVRTTVPDEATGVTVWPLALLPDQQLRGVGAREPFRFQVRHLVTSVLPAMLDKVLVAAVHAGQPLITLEPPEPELWLALGARPRPALLVDVPAMISRAQPVAPRVRGPLRIAGGPVQAVRGRVVGPGDVPLPGVQVEIISTGTAVRTGSDGRFSLSAAPAGVVPVRLRGKGLDFLVDLPPGPDEEFLIHCDIQED